MVLLMLVVMTDQTTKTLINQFVNVGDNEYDGIGCSEILLESMYIQKRRHAFYLLEFRNLTSFNNIRNTRI